MLAFELTNSITTSHLVCCTFTPERVGGIRLFWLLILFLICFFCCISILFFLLVLGLRSSTLLGLLPLTLGMGAIFGDYKAVVATLGPGERDLVLSHALPMAMSNPPTIFDSKWDTLPFCFIPGLIDKLPQLFLILVRSINVLKPKQDSHLGDRHA